MQAWKRLLRMMRWQLLFVLCFGTYLLSYGYSAKTFKIYSRAAERLQQIFHLELSHRHKRLQELATSPQLRHALDHQLEQLVSGELRASLQAGLLEFLMLADRSCKTVYVQKLSPGPHHVCAEVMALEFLGSEPQARRLGNVLYQVAKIPDESGFFLVSSLVLDKTWLQKQQALMEIPSDLDFSEAEEKLEWQRLLPSSFGEVNLEESLPLVVNSSWKRLLLVFAGQMRAHHELIVMIFMSFVLLLTCGQLYVLRRVGRQFAKEISPALKEIQRVLGMELASPATTSKKENFDLHLEVIGDRLREILVLRDEQLIELRDQVQNAQEGLQLAQAKLRQVRTESEQHRDRAAQRGLCDFLLKDIRRMSAEAGMTIVLVRSRLDRMQNRSLNPVVQLLREWQSGIAERGARKMVRSLAEAIDGESKVSMLETQIGQFMSWQDSLFLESQAAMRGVSSALSMQARIQSAGTFLDLALNPVAVSVQHLAGLHRDLAHYFNGMKPKALQIDFSQASSIIEVNDLHSQAFPVYVYLYYYFFLYREHLASGELRHRMELVNGQLSHEFSCEGSPKLSAAMERGHPTDVTWSKILDLCENHQISLQIMPHKFGHFVMVLNETLQKGAYSPIGQKPPSHATLRQ